MHKEREANWKLREKLVKQRKERRRKLSLRKILQPATLNEENFLRKLYGQHLCIE